MSGTTDDQPPESDAGTLHQALVQRLKDNGLLGDPRVEAAFRAVPRHLFLPDVALKRVYTDDAVPTRMRDGVPVSSSSQPAVMAIMLGQLDPQPGDRVLEIGAGTGYNAALLAHIIGPTGQVVTIDIDEDIVDDAHAHLTAAAFSDVTVVCRDGAMGYAEAAPYDRIILTVSAWDIAPAWFQQLRPGGRLVLPLALNGVVQKLVAFEWRDGYLESASVQDGAFMPLRGACAVPPLFTPLGPEPHLTLAVAAPRPVEAKRVYSLVTGPYEDLPTPLHVTPGDLWGGVSLWLSLHAPAMCGLVARGKAAERQMIPSPFSDAPTFRATVGLLDDRGLCLLSRVPDEASLSAATPFTLSVRSFGSDDELARRLIDLLRAWEEAGRPSTSGLRIRAYPADAAPQAAPDSLVIAKPGTRLVLDWP